MPGISSSGTEWPIHSIAVSPSLTSDAPKSRSSWTMRPISMPWPNTMLRATSRRPGWVSSRARYMKPIATACSWCSAHVLEEPDVDRVGVAATARVADHPADHPGEQGRGHDDHGDVERTLPPGQHDRVVRIAVVAVVTGCVVGLASRSSPAARASSRSSTSSTLSSSTPMWPLFIPSVCQRSRNPQRRHSPQQRRQRQPVSDVAGTELVEHVAPSRATRRVPPRRVRSVHRRTSADVAANRWNVRSDNAVVREVRGHQRQRAGSPARLLDGLASGGLGGCLALVDRGRPGSPTPRCRW